uniref:Uncharacterized protein n=1 Tax=Oryza glaberrima TaxID=4538 RepID=I1Q868_ORYGL
MSSSPLVLTVLLFASLTGLVVLAPRSSSPPATATPSPPVVGDGVGGGGEDGDLALFRRATLDGGEGAAAMAVAEPKVAFLFLTNSELTFAPLWERFFEGHGERLNVYVHADPAARLMMPPTRSFKGRFVAAGPTKRADATLIAAARRLLAAALVDDAANAYFALLSQHCVPVHSFRHLHATLFPPPPRRPRRRAANAASRATSRCSTASRRWRRGTRRAARAPCFPRSRSTGSAWAPSSSHSRGATPRSLSASAASGTSSGSRAWTRTRATRRSTTSRRCSTWPTPPASRGTR